MVNLHTDLCNEMAIQMTKQIQLEEDRLFLFQMGGLIGAELAKERYGLDPSVYYLYVHLLKYGWMVEEVGDLSGAYIVKISGGPNAKYKNIILEKQK